MLPRHGLPITVFFLAACSSDGTPGAGTTGSDPGTTASEPATTASEPATTSNPNGTTTAPSDDSSNAGDDTGNISSTDTGSSTDSSTDGPQRECRDDDECVGAAPFCIRGWCSGCDAADDPHAVCAATSPDAPWCFEGVCAPCLPGDPTSCSVEAPNCDAVTLTCGPCYEHAHCPDSACHIGTGLCLVDTDDAIPTVGVGADYATLDAALAGLQTGEVAILRLQASATPFTASIILNDGVTVAFLAEPGPLPAWETGSAVPLRVYDATAFVHRISFEDNGSQLFAIEVEGGSVYVDRSRFGNNLSGGVRGESGAFVDIRNSFVGSGPNVDALQIATGSNATVLSSTLAAGVGVGWSILVGPGSSVDVRNSILVNNSTQLDFLGCAGTCEINHSVVEIDVGGVGNYVAGEVNTAWFQDYVAGDFHLTAAAPPEFATVAVWMAGDPLTDFDFEPRVGIDGGTEHAGADIP